MMANILAIEACTSVCSVSLSTHNKQIDRYIDNNQKPSLLLLPLIKEVLIEGEIKLSELDYIVYTKGPGAFTGVRLCLGVVQGLSLANNTPTVGYSTLEVLAFGVIKKNAFNPCLVDIVATLDARMGEVYWAQYSAGKCMVQGIDKPEALPNFNDNIIGIGSGWDVYGQLDNLKKYNYITQQHPNSKHLLQLAIQQNKNNLLIIDEIPSALYFRNNVAKKSNEQRSYIDKK